MAEAQDGPVLSRWERFLAALSPLAQSQQRPVEPGEELAVSPAFQHAVEALSPLARQAVDAAASVPPSAWPGGRKPLWLMVEAEEGEWANIKVFRTEDALLRRLRALEGKDVQAFAVYGIPIPFSRAPHRIVFLPDGQARQLGVQITAVEVMETQVTLQEDGFLGPPELAVSGSPGALPPPPPPAPPATETDQTAPVDG